MKYSLLIVRGFLIGFGSFEILWFIYLYLTSGFYDRNSRISMQPVPFFLSYPNFVIPVMVISMITKRWFSLDKSWLFDLGEGLGISIIYFAVAFVINTVNLGVGWSVGEEWGDGYFTWRWIPDLGAFTLFSFLVLPFVVLFVRNFIEKPVSGRWINQPTLK